MDNSYVTKSVSSDIQDPGGKSLGIERYSKATLQGTVLEKFERNPDKTLGASLGVVVNNSITDSHGRDYIGLNIEIEPGYDRFVQSADPVIQAQIMAAKAGDLVYVEGVEKKRGSNIRILTYTTLKAAPSALALVENAKGTGENSTATEAVAA